MKVPVKVPVKVQVLHGANGIARAVDLIAAGECVALPTETVYGLAADAANERAVAKIFEAKGRPKNHPLIVHIPSAEHLDQWARDVPQQAQMLARACWPGPLTLLLKRAAATPLAVTGGLDTVGIRVPAHPLFLEVLETAGTGLAAPSANRYKALSPTSAEQVVDGLEGRITAVLDGGPCEFGLESTIVDFTNDGLTNDGQGKVAPRIVRAGPLSQQYLQEIIGSNIELPVEHDAIVPGNVQAHYQPKTPMRLFTPQETDYVNAIAQQAGFVCYSTDVKQRLFDAAVQHAVSPERIIHLSQQASGYAQQIYASLHSLDQMGLQTLWLERPPEEADWVAVNDRLQRALGLSRL